MSVSPRDSFKPFLVSYRYEGAVWNIELPAQSLEDAERRVSALTYAKCDGEVVARLPVPTTFSGLFRAVKRLVA